tara:strand:- start:2996 stop:3157 length:162 start_codon:yes stop_codon:yes gene_type:complete
MGQAIYNFMQVEIIDTMKTNPVYTNPVYIPNNTTTTIPYNHVKPTSNCNFSKT